jgi:hypothetical protein
MRFPATTCSPNISMSESLPPGAATTKRVGCSAASVKATGGRTIGWNANDVLRMIKQRAREAGLPYSTCWAILSARQQQVETGLATAVVNADDFVAHRQAGKHGRESGEQLVERQRLHYGSARRLSFRPAIQDAHGAEGRRSREALVSPCYGVILLRRVA